MTNEEYRQMRGTDRPFDTNPVKIRRAWYHINRADIDERRRRKRKYGG